MVLGPLPNHRHPLKGAPSLSQGEQPLLDSSDELSRSLTNCYRVIGPETNWTMHRMGGRQDDSNLLLSPYSEMGQNAPQRQFP
jgi:hypothetical protein